jgi:hypothetical protein
LDRSRRTSTDVSGGRSASARADSHMPTGVRARSGCSWFSDAASSRSSSAAQLRAMLAP